MKTLIIYVSFHHRNTEKIARVMAKALDARLLPLNKAKPEDVRTADLIGLGSGIFFWKHHEGLIRFSRLMPPFKKRAFLFSTRGIGPWRFYHRVVRRILKKKGYKIPGEFSSRGYDTAGPLRFLGGISKGRPDAKDLKKARRFALSLLPKKSP